MTNREIETEGTFMGYEEFARMLSARCRARAAEARTLCDSLMPGSEAKAFYRGKEAAFSEVEKMLAEIGDILREEIHG